MVMNFRLIVVLAALPAAASFALGGKIDGPGKPKAAADVEPGAVCKRMTESTEESIARPFRAGRLTKSTSRSHTVPRALTLTWSPRPSVQAPHHRGLN